jgi:hypothetical protein
MANRVEIGLGDPALPLDSWPSRPASRQHLGRRCALFTVGLALFVRELHGKCRAAQGEPIARPCGGFWTSADGRRDAGEAKGGPALGRSRHLRHCRFVRRSECRPRADRTVRSTRNSDPFFSLSPASWRSKKNAANVLRRRRTNASDRDSRHSATQVRTRFALGHLIWG